MGSQQMLLLHLLHLLPQRLQITSDFRGKLRPVVQHEHPKGHSVIFPI